MASASLKLLLLVSVSLLLGVTSAQGRSVIKLMREKFYGMKIVFIRWC